VKQTPQLLLNIQHDKASPLMHDHQAAVTRENYWLQRHAVETFEKHNHAVKTDIYIQHLTRAQQSITGLAHLHIS